MSDSDKVVCRVSLQGIVELTEGLQLSILVDMVTESISHRQTSDDVSRRVFRSVVKGNCEYPPKDVD